ncbi:MAG: adenylate/guanylate cyclase domain-containing protein [Arenimonas sp.]|nr:adenylate/guanylate cyclase domain-containing protein [Arenimonas sp.]
MAGNKQVSVRLPLLVLAAIALALQLSGLLERADHRLGDWLLARHAASRLPPDDIVVVGIDQRSLELMLEEAGSWPWPRAIHGELLEGLAPFEPRAIAFDLMFNEADRFREDSDLYFKDVVAAQDNLFMPSALMDSGNLAPLSMLPPSFGAVRGPDADPAAAATLLVPLVLDETSWRGGLINFEADDDGTGRHYRLWKEIGGWRLGWMAPNVAAFTGATLPDQETLRLHWFGQAPKTISFVDLFHDLGQREPRIAPTLRGKILLIAPTAPSLFDLRPTPIATGTSGVHILTTAIANLRAGDWLRDLPSRWPLALLLSAAVVVAFRRRASPVRTGLGLGLASALLLLAAWALFRANLYAPVGAALLLGWVAFAVFTVEGQRRERREREATVGLFGRFLDPRVVQGLVESGELDRERRPEARQITILFSDIRGFTTLSETRSPEQVVDLLNRYFTRQVEVIYRHGGTLDKFIGDAVMAFWNAPTESPDHARRAVNAALDMLVALDDFKRELAERGEGLGEFDIGIGLHTGPAVVGFLGSDSRMEYTAIGDTVNLGSRIEGTTKGVARVLVSNSTRDACAGAAELRFTHRGQFKVKGREQPVDLYEPERADDAS